MDAATLKQLIQQHLPDAEVMCQGDDGRHFDALVVSAAFNGLNAVKKQQLVYQALGNLITSGVVHALSLKTLTPEEWEKQRGSHSHG